MSSNNTHREAEEQAIRRLGNEHLASIDHHDDESSKGKGDTIQYYHILRYNLGELFMVKMPNEGKPEESEARVIVLPPRIHKVTRAHYL